MSIITSKSSLDRNKLGDYLIDNKGWSIGCNEYDPKRPDQLFFAEEQHKSAKAASEKIRQGSDFDEVFQFLCDARSKIAFQMKKLFNIGDQRYLEKVGKERTIGEFSYTPGFSYVNPINTETMFNGEDDTLGFVFGDELFPPDTEVKKFRRDVQLLEEKVPLTTVTRSLETTKLNLNGKSKEEPRLFFEHTDPIFFNAIKKHLRGLFTKVKESKLPREIVELTARIHWWLAQACIPKRGSASIADMFSKALLFAKGMKVGKWVDYLRPDIEAIIRPLEDFVGNYRSFFATKN